MDKYRLILICSLAFSCLVSTRSDAQLDYRFSQFLQNPTPVNPAFSGIEDFLDIKTGFRQQWLGIDNAPSYALFSAQMAFNVRKSSEHVLQGTRLNEPNDYVELEAPSTFAKRKGNRHGVGLYGLQSKVGGFNNLGAFANYAYHLQITRTLVWSIGTSLGIESNKFDANGISVLNPSNDLAYLNYLQDGGMKQSFKTHFGTLVYHKQFYAGYAMLNAIDVLISGDNTDFNNQFEGLQHNIMGGYNLNMLPGFLVSPSILLSLSDNRSNQYIGNLRVKYKDLIWAGIQYNYQSTLSFSVGGYIIPEIGINYSYGYPTTKINTISSGSHEIILGIKLLNKNYSSSYMW
jgi:type IX secretion system PorP/SprF family membrane protein